MPNPSESDPPIPDSAVGRAAAQDDAGSADPLGPIFPPRPAAEAASTPYAEPLFAEPPYAKPPYAEPLFGEPPMGEPPAASAAVRSLADSLPAGELRKALDLLLRYAERFDGAVPHGTAPDPAVPCGGIAAETGEA